MATKMDAIEALSALRGFIGKDQRRALAEASRLNPLSPEIADYRARLAAKRKTARTP